MFRKNNQEKMACTRDLTNKTNETLLLQFENWFNSRITY